MVWQYSQSTGELTKDGTAIGAGYSGTGAGRNNPAMQSVPDIGPTPQGAYNIGLAYNDPHLGPCVMHLDPEPDTNTFGRSLFRIHGDNSVHDASHGCIILGPLLRHEIASSGDHDMIVIA